MAPMIQRFSIYFSRGENKQWWRFHFPTLKLVSSAGGFILHGEAAPHRQSQPASPLLNVYRTRGWTEQRSSCFCWIRLALSGARTHARTSPSHPETVEESSLGTAPRHEGQLCFSGPEVEELHPPPPPFPALVARLPLTFPSPLPPRDATVPNVTRKLCPT